ncbi:hypothetical protein GCM10007981_15080 [Thermocladium modestius]|uniref:Uncharacterized protein n=1 Tax=Thermocladium modestius TaxID=62609 RepID=A0A830GWZ4_9CREN|nr:hypothetical protein [Thermocladium modestius]GGP21800.1 hypothetical protein GCM10007981_15080 [Thermocladium modestius]
MNIDEIKSWISSLLAKEQKVFLNRLLEEAEARGIGRIALFMAINSIIQEDKDIVAMNPVEIGRIKLGKEEIRISLPQEIELKRNTRQRRRSPKGINIIEALYEEQRQETKPKEEQRQETKPKEEQRQETKPKEEQRQETKPKEEQRQETKPKEELIIPGFNDEESQRAALAIIQYINKYWSVGRMRLVDDLYHSTGIRRETLIRVLDVLSKQGYVELVEPGIVNRTEKTPTIGIKLTELIKR